MIYLALLAAFAAWIAWAYFTAPFEPVAWSLPEIPGIVDLHGDARDGGE